MNRHLDYTVRTTDTASVPKSQARKPNDEVRRRFEALMGATFDDKGRLRAEHRPEPKPQPSKKSESPSLFIIDMLGDDGRLRPFVS